MRPAVFLDRDGVLNKLVWRDGWRVSPRALSEFEVLPEAAACVEALRGAGLLLVVVTNQPDIARGFLAPAELESMHARLQELLPVDAIYVCPHDDPDGCLCRKPKAGLLLRASREMDIDLEASYLVGDNWKDITAGCAAGCKTVFVQGEEGDRTGISADFVVSSVGRAAELILAAGVVAPPSKRQAPARTQVREPRPKAKRTRRITP